MPPKRRQSRSRASRAAVLLTICDYSSDVLVFVFVHDYDYEYDYENEQGELHKT